MSVKLDIFAKQTVPGVTWLKRLWCYMSGHNCELVRTEIQKINNILPADITPDPAPGIIFIEIINSLSEIVEIKTQVVRCTKCGGIFRQNFYKHKQCLFSSWSEMHVGNVRVIPPA